MTTETAAATTTPAATTTTAATPPDAGGATDAGAAADAALLDAGSDSPFDDVDTSFLGTLNDAPEPDAAAAPQEPAPAAAAAPAPVQPDAQGATAEAPAADPSKPGDVPPTPPLAPSADGQPSATTPAQQQPVDAAESARLLTEYRTKAMQGLEAYFQLDEASADLLATEPQKAVPQLMARTMFETIQATMQAVHYHLPALIRNITAREQQTRSYEDKFYAAWPKLDRGNAEHAKAVDTFARAYRQVNPQAKFEDLVRDVGAQVSVALKLPLDAATAPANGAAQGATTAAQAIPPHRPAAAAAPRSGPAADGASANIFERMAEDFISGREHDD